MTRGVGVLGGTFDPIHYGHLRMADEVATALEFIETRLIPAGDPYHRAAGVPVTPALQRLAMARLGVLEFPRLAVDPREALRPGPSYTIDTLTGLREELGATPILLLVGADTFSTLPAWKRWQELFGLAHVVVVARPGYVLPGTHPAALASELAARLTDDPGLLSSVAGRIYRQAISPQPISATRIRALAGAGQRLDGLVPPAVAEYIASHSLYRS